MNKESQDVRINQYGADNSFSWDKHDLLRVRQGRGRRRRGRRGDRARVRPRGARQVATPRTTSARHRCAATSRSSQRPATQRRRTVGDARSGQARRCRATGTTSAPDTGPAAACEPRCHQVLVRGLPDRCTTTVRSRSHALWDIRTASVPAPLTGSSSSAVRLRPGNQLRGGVAHRRRRTRSYGSDDRHAEASQCPTTSCAGHGSSFSA